MNKAISVNTKDLGIIQCDYEASSLISGADRMNKSLARMRQLLEATYPKEQINEPEYELYVYESEAINAFSVKSGSGYVIAFSTAMFVKFYTTVKNLFTVRKICDWFGTTPEESAVCVNAVYDYMLWFIAYHEFFHMCNGHCDYFDARGMLSAETVRERDEEKNILMQIMEGDADYSAACSCVKFIFVQALNAGAYDSEREAAFRDDILTRAKTEIIFLGYAIYQVFLLFSDGERGKTPELINNLLKYDHPYASIRLVYSSCAMTYQMGDFLSQEEITKLLHSLYEICIAYDRIYYAMEDFANSLLSLAFTERGVQHIMFIHNEWNRIYNELIPYAYLTPGKKEELAAAYYWVNEDGSMKIK